VPSAGLWWERYRNLGHPKGIGRCTASVNMFVLIMWWNRPDWAKAASSLRFLDHTQARAPGRTDQLITDVAAYTTYEHPWSQRDSNPQSQQSCRFKPTSQTAQTPRRIADTFSSALGGKDEAVGTSQLGRWARQRAEFESCYGCEMYRLRCCVSPSLSVSRGLCRLNRNICQLRIECRCA